MAGLLAAYSLSIGDGIQPHRSCADAVRRWVYEPMIINGRPRGVTFSVTVRFELK
jgi:hypothetical protein